MAVFTDTRRRFRIAAYVLGGITALSIIYLLLPVGAATEQKARDLLNQQNEAKTLEAQVRPLRSMPELLGRSQKDIADFYTKRLPARYSTVISEIGRLAAQNGVRVSDVAYDTVDVSTVEGLRAVKMNAAVSGRYQNLARFINALERNQKVFFLIKSVNLGGEQRGGVDLAIQLETYLRPPTPADFKAEERPRRVAAVDPEAD